MPDDPNLGILTIIESRQLPIGFAHRGARAHAPDNTIESFLLAQKMGASALESDVWITADGQAVLDHDGVVPGRDGNVRIRSVVRSELPPHIPTLSEFYAACGTDFELSLDVKDSDAAAEVVAVSSQVDASMVGRLWLCHPESAIVASWRKLSEEVVLVDSTRRKRITEGLVRRLATLVDLRIDAINMHRSDWSDGDVQNVHEHGLKAMAWDIQDPTELDRLLAMGVDAIFSDHVDRMQNALVRVKHRSP